MNIASLCKMNEITLPKDEEAILDKLEEVFGKTSLIGDEYSFGEKIGLVTKEVDENRVSVRFIDQNGDDILWDGKPVELIRKNVNQMKVGRYYTQELYRKGDDLFTRRPSLAIMKNILPSEEEDEPSGNAVLSNGEGEAFKKADVPNGQDVPPVKTPAVTVSKKPRNLASVKERLKAQGYHCNMKVLAQFLCGMNTNQIIILHGAPGMGKTSFVKQIARVLDAECKIIPVRPNWIDNQDLTGYFNPVEHRYYATPFLDALCEAKENPEKTYFVCLDEMNLAHVEYYFSDVLSAMESGEGIPLYSEREQENAVKRQQIILDSEKKGTVAYLDAMIDRENLVSYYTPNFMLPKNVVFVGTLNMDATTNDLSPKVIDRSCIIRVTKDTGEELRTYEDGAAGKEELRGEESFEKKLLCALKAQTSNRVETQWAAMEERRNDELLKGQLSDLDFQDMFLAMKVLPALNAEEVDCTVTEDEIIIEDLRIDEETEKKYPLSVRYLRQMCVPDEKVLNYWRMR